MLRLSSVICSLCTVTLLPPGSPLFPYTTLFRSEEWAGASPVYAQRIQRALNFVGNDVPTIFKGMQFDIGSPPQFMEDRKSTRLNSSHVAISYAVFCLKKTKLYQDDIRAWGRRCE